jgi:serine/threonine protein phosphatase PrpC
MFSKKKRKRQNKVGLERNSFATVPVLTERVIRKVHMLTTSMYSVVGNRDQQQDSMYVTPSKNLVSNRKKRVLAIVCDGLGGMADGGKASRIAMQIIVQRFQKLEKNSAFNIPLFFRRGILTADRVIYEFSKKNRKGSGTTMVACIVEDNKLYWASVGDSRIYIIRNRQILQITRDHNYGLCLLKKMYVGEMTVEEAMRNKKKAALISYLGIGNISLMDINDNPLKLLHGDIVMLCSDGLTKTLSDSRIKEIIMTDILKFEEKAESLVKIATYANAYSQDNTSVILIHYEEMEREQKMRQFKSD